MKISVVAARELSTDQEIAWTDLVRADPRWHSPFFHPGFTRAVSAVRRDVYVALIEQSDRLVGVFPFQRRANGVGHPVGGRMSDFQAVILAPGASVEAAHLMRACGLSTWHFDHLILESPSLERYQWTRLESPYIDVSPDFDAYLKERRAAGRSGIAKMLKRRARAEREIGAIRFEFRSCDEQALPTLIRWKAEQFRNMQVADLFAARWTTSLLERLLSMQDDREFGGVLSSLYFQDHLVSVQVCIRAANVLHCWLTAYNHEFAKYSPGTQLMLELVRAAGADGVTRIDLGKGEETYKRDLMTGATGIAHGCVAMRPGVAAAHRFWHQSKQWIKGTSLHRSVSGPWRAFRRLRDQVFFS